MHSQAVSSRKPKVSIIIPTYNQEAYIEKAIESALMQDYKNLEVIVSDDFSIDNTSVVAQKFAEHKNFKYIRNTNNLGRTGNYRNTLYHHTTGEWIVNLDGDDYYTDNEFISRAINSIQVAQEQGKNIVAYCGKQSSLLRIRKNIPHQNIDDHSLVVNGKIYFKEYCKIGIFSHMRTLYKKDAATPLNMYDKSYQASDFYSLIKVFMTGDIILSDYSIGVWRIHKTNTTITEADKKYIQSLETFKDIILFAQNYFSDKELTDWYKEACKSAHKDYVSTYIHYNRNIKSIFLLLKSFRFQYSYFRLWLFLIFNR